jgi:acyl-CoA synthetase (AMP-forming)/AMP-acid ligase II
VNVAALLGNTARSFPDRVAWFWDGRTRTYGESDRRADALAHALTARGIGRGERVAILMENRPEVVETMFGCWKAGIAVAPLNAKFTAGEIVFHLADAGARVVVADRKLAAVVGALRDRVPTVELVIEVGDGPEETGTGEGFLSWARLQAGHDGTRFPEVDVDRDDLAWLAYTSGTTGRPKGAMLSHGVLTFEALGMLADFFPLGVHDVGMHAAPLTHGSGHVALVFVAAGCGQVLMPPTGFDAALFLELVERHRVAALFLVPTIIKLVVEHPDAARRDLSSLRWVFYGGSPMYVEDIRRAHGVLGRIFNQGFGQTESPMTGTILRADEHDPDGPFAHRLASCGRARTGVQIRILDPQDRVLPDGEIGEICIRGGSVMVGYWQRPEETAQTLRGGWLHTGDLGRMDSDGYVYILDRSKDMVISGGLNVYPREVEEVLLTHPDVGEACVFGVPDPTWGEAVTAHVVARDGAELSVPELIAFAREQLAGYKLPKAVQVVEALVKTAYGKVDKKAIRAPYWQGRDRMVG